MINLIFTRQFSLLHILALAIVYDLDIAFLPMVFIAVLALFLVDIIEYLLKTFHE